MGNKLTAPECFQTLNIPSIAQKKSKFKSEVLNFCTGQKLPAATLAATSLEQRQSLVKAYLDSDYQRYRQSDQASRSTKDGPTEKKLQEALLHLLNSWIRQMDKQASQDDPEYAASTSTTLDVSTQARKRKRPSIESIQTQSFTQRTVEGQRSDFIDLDSDTSHHMAEDTSTAPPLTTQDRHAHPARSQTIGNSSESVHNIEIRNGDYGDGNDSDALPSHSTILADRSDRIDHAMPDVLAEPSHPTESGKGKEPVRDPPTPPARAKITLSRAHAKGKQGHTRIPNKSKTLFVAPSAGEEQYPANNTRDNIDGGAATPDSLQQSSRQRRLFRRIDDIEASEEPQNQSLSAPTSANLQTQFHSEHRTSSVADGTMTPPPTVKRAAAARKVDVFRPRSPTLEHNPMTPSRSLPDDRRQQALDVIMDYISECEAHSNRMATDASNSIREKQNHSIRAVAWGNMKGDIESRIAAVMNGDGEDFDETQIRSYCLHL